MWRTVILASGLAAATAACTASKLERRTQALEDTLASVQRDQALAAARLDEIDRLNQTVFALQDRVEQLSVALERLQSGAVEPGDVPASPPVSEASPGRVAQPAPPLDFGSSDPVALYRKAYDLLKQGQYGQAIDSFRRLIERYPDHDLSDNAQYWIGEAYYAQQDYKRALEEFSKVVDTYGKGNKVPDALLKMAYCYAELGDKQRARESLKRVLRDYPWSDPAKKAKERLGALGAISKAKEEA